MKRCAGELAKGFVLGVAVWMWFVLTGSSPRRRSQKGEREREGGAGIE